MGKRQCKCLPPTLDQWQYIKPCFIPLHHFPVKPLAAIIQCIDESYSRKKIC